MIELYIEIGDELESSMTIKKIRLGEDAIKILMDAMDFRKTVKNKFQRIIDLHDKNQKGEDK